MKRGTRAGLLTGTNRAHSAVIQSAVPVLKKIQSFPEIERVLPGEISPKGGRNFSVQCSLIHGGILFRVKGAGVQVFRAYGRATQARFQEIATEVQNTFS